MSQFKPSDQALEILKKRYFLKGENWEGLCKRVSKFLANNDDEEKRFFDVMFNGLFLPNSPCLMNAGTDNPMLSACFVLDVEDNMDSIFGTLHNAAKIFKGGGGVGFNFGNIRPAGSRVDSTNGVASGPISFLKIFDAAINEIKQGGKRRGAAMCLMPIDHPDIVKFIKCKNVDKQISNFNISVAVTDEFMARVERVPNESFYTEFNGVVYQTSKDNDTPIDHFHQNPNVYSKKDVWDLICQQAHHTGEPGVVFWDEIIRYDDSICGLNPCAEQPLENKGFCCLGSIDVSKFFGYNYDFEMDKFKDVIKTSVDLLNRIIDKGIHPLGDEAKEVIEKRKIGLGVMGFADVLLKKEIRYGSEDSFRTACTLMDLISSTARKYSLDRGYNNEKLTTIAPTGTLSIIAGCSSGIEPVFSFQTVHKREDLKTWTQFHPLAKEYLDRGEKLPEYFVTANDVSVDEHVRMQATFQKYIDSSISKTINMPSTATVEDVQNAYKLAWELKCKGITVYRDGSRQDQVLSDANKECKEEIKEFEDRPKTLKGTTTKYKVDIGDDVRNLYVTVNENPDDSNKPYEVFMSGEIRVADKLVAQIMDLTTRLSSLALRGLIPPHKLVEQLEKVSCENMFSIPHKIAQALREFGGDTQKVTQKCPECGSDVMFIEGCISCNCGWSKCGG